MTWELSLLISNFGLKKCPDQLGLTVLSWAANIFDRTHLLSKIWTPFPQYALYIPNFGVLHQLGFNCSARRFSRDLDIFFQYVRIRSITGVRLSFRISVLNNNNRLDFNFAKFWIVLVSFSRFGWRLPSSHPIAE